MPRRYRPREVVRVLERLGWRVVRVRGDHARLVKDDGKAPVTVPLAPRELGPKTLGYVLNQAGMTLKEFQAVAEEVL